MVWIFELCSVECRIFTHDVETSSLCVMSVNSKHGCIYNVIHVCLIKICLSLVFLWHLSQSLLHRTGRAPNTSYKVKSAIFVLIQRSQYYPWLRLLSDVMSDWESVSAHQAFFIPTKSWKRGERKPDRPEEAGGSSIKWVIKMGN